MALAVAEDGRGGGSDAVACRADSLTLFEGVLTPSGFLDTGGKTLLVLVGFRVGSVWSGSSEGSLLSFLMRFTATPLRGVGVLEEGLFNGFDVGFRRPSATASSSLRLCRRLRLRSSVARFTFLRSASHLSTSNGGSPSSSIRFLVISHSSIGMLFVKFSPAILWSVPIPTWSSAMILMSLRCNF